MWNNPYFLPGSDSSLPSESSSICSYESSDEEGHFSYSDLSPEYNENSFHLESGFKKLRIKDDQDTLPIQYNKSGPIRPIFPFDAFSNLREINEEHFWKITFLSHNHAIHISFGFYRCNPAELISYLDSKVSIHHKKYTQNLAIELTGSNLPSQEFRTLIAIFAKAFPSTKYLSLNFHHFITKNRTNEDLIWLSHHFTKYMPNLKHFILQFNENNLITSEGLKILCRQIAKRSKRLECLSLDFTKCERITGYHLRSLTRYMSICLRHLKNLRLDIRIDLPNDIKKVSFNKTRYLKQIESLDLGINPGEQTKMNAKFPKDLRQLSLYLAISPYFPIILDQLSSCYLQPIHNLKSLNLQLPFLTCFEDGPQKFVEILNSKIKTLEHLKIHFCACLTIIEEFLTSFKCPESNNQLKKLELGFDSSSENSFLQTLRVELFSPFTSNFLQHLKNLTYLDLRLQTLQIQDPQVKNMTACISKDLPRLEFLNIYLFLCPQITDEIVKAFQEDFCAESSLISLKTLILSFSNCHLITKKPIKSLRSALKKRTPAIESATVNFIDYQDDSNYCSEDDEDYDIAQRMAAGWGHQWKAVKVDPNADPNDENNWRIFLREDLAAREPSYDESDGPEDEENEGEDKI